MKLDNVTDLLIIGIFIVNIYIIAAGGLGPISNAFSIISIGGCVLYAISRWGERKYK